jgi:hypothetical protein
MMDFSTQFYSVDVLVSSILLRNQTPVPLREEKTNHHNSNNAFTLEASFLCVLGATVGWIEYRP